jgi:hypothetical protein
VAIFAGGLMRPLRRGGGNVGKGIGAQGFAEAPAPGLLAVLNRLRVFRASARDTASCLWHDVICFFITLRMKGAKIFELTPYTPSYRLGVLRALV